MKIRRIRPEDANDLVKFYNDLSEKSKRTFQPLGITTTLDACKMIIGDNSSEVDKKFDLVAWHETQLVGWGFLWEVRSNQPTFGLAIADDFQGQGLGSELIDRVLEEARKRDLRKIFLTVVKDNEVAWKLCQLPPPKGGGLCEQVYIDQLKS